MNLLFRHYKLIDLFFRGSSYGERKYFLSNFKDDLFKEEVAKLTNLFNSYPFRHSAIITNTLGFNDRKKITNWQRSYYLSVYSAYQEFILEKQRGNDLSNYYDLMNVYETLLKNTSFTFLVNLMKEIDDDINKEASTSPLLNDLISYHIIKSNPKELEEIKNLSSQGIDDSLQEMSKEEIKKRVSDQLVTIMNIKV